MGKMLSKEKSYSNKSSKNLKEGGSIKSGINKIRKGIQVSEYSNPFLYDITRRTSDTIIKLDLPLNENRSFQTKDFLFTPF